MNSETNYIKKFLDVLEDADYSIRLYDKFREFCKISAFSISAAFQPYKSGEALKGINHIKLQKYQNAFDIMVEALTERKQDFLGQFFSLNNFGNRKNGQTFTPYHVSLLIAQMQSGYESIINRRGYITVSDPASGAGGMIIAFAQTLEEAGFNPSQNMFASLTDIDELCFYMSYIQISLYGIPARVVWGNTLTNKCYLTLFTPVYFLSKKGI